MGYFLSILLSLLSYPSCRSAHLQVLFPLSPLPPPPPLVPPSPFLPSFLLVVPLSRPRTLTHATRGSTPSYPMSVLSHYPPDTKVKYQDQPGYRICGAVFANTNVEYEIVRLAAGIGHDKQIQEKPW